MFLPLARKASLIHVLAFGQASLTVVPGPRGSSSRWRASSIKAHLHFTVQIKVSFHVLVHGLGGPVGEDGAHGDDGGLRDAGIGINVLA